MSNTRKAKMQLPYRRPDVTGYPAPPARNVYQCATCRGRIVVVHAHQGVTPMFLACRATPGCEGRSHSLGYPPEDWIESLGIKPSFAWALPTAQEWHRLDAGIRDHIERGGLMLKPLRPVGSVQGSRESK